MPQGRITTHKWAYCLSAIATLLCAAAGPVLAQEAQQSAPLPVILAAGPADTVLAVAPAQSPVSPPSAVTLSDTAPSVRQSVEPVAVAALPDVNGAPPPEPQTAGEPAQHGSTGILGLHSDITFAVLSAPRKQAEGDAQPSAFEAQVKRIAAGLQVSARGLYPDAVKRIGNFDVYIADSESLSTMSSGTGRIAINAGFAKLNPTDDWLAFVIAREMAHVVAGHHDNNSGASLAVSVLMNFVVPGSGLIKSAISFAGSQIASASGRDKQIKEADELAIKLLEGAGYTSRSVVLNLRLNPLTEQTSTTSWANAFRGSAERLTAATLPGVAPASAVVQAADAAGGPQAVPLMQTAAAPAQSAPPPPIGGRTRWQPEELVRTRPSGLPGPLLLGGNEVPLRRIE
jgi:hypothetical protein